MVPILWKVYFKTFFTFKIWLNIPMFLTSEFTPFYPFCHPCLKKGIKLSNRNTVCYFKMYNENSYLSRKSSEKISTSNHLL